MAGTREQILDALLAIITGSSSFAASGRRNRSPESITVTLSPAVFLVKGSETYQRPSLALPPVRTLNAKAFFYNNAGPNLNAIPEAAINAALDALDLALKPAGLDAAAGRFTLGGLCYSCIISGEAKSAPGEVTGLSLAIVPFEIIIP